MKTDFNTMLNLIEQQKTAMLTTQQNDGHLKARPMQLSKLEKDGTMWFFNNENSCKANEIKEHSLVNLSFTDEKKNSYVTISGAASLVHDQEKMDELMSPMVKAWFPKGTDDPSISLLKIDFEKGAYWQTKENKLQQSYEITKALLTEEKVDIGEHETVES